MLLLFIYLAFSRMASIIYSYDTWWPVVSNISTYKFIFNKIRNAPFNLWNNLGWTFTFGSAFYSAFWDWSTMMIVTIICFTALKGLSILWRLWMIVTSFYWWLKAIYLFILGDKSWRRPLPKEVLERKRARRAVRKLYPGLSRKKSLTLAQMYQPPTHEDNSFRSAIKHRRYTSHFRPIQQPMIMQSLRSWILHIWNQHQTAPRRNEINLILLSLLLMVGYRIVVFTLYCVQKIPSKWILMPIRLPAHCFLWIWSKLLDMIIWPFIKKKPPDSPEYIFVNARRKGKCHMVFASIYNIDEKVKNLSEKSVYFDTDTSFVICDNSANTHICNNKHMFSELRELESPNTVATIGGRNSKPSGIGTVTWSWQDDDGKTHRYEFEDVYYFPQSPVNILSVTTFAKFLKDEDGTGIDTKASYSRLYWDHNKYSRKFVHSDSNLPEMPINEGNTVFAWFMSKFKRQCNDQIDQFCCLTNAHLHESDSVFRVKVNRPDPLKKVDESDTFLESMIYPDELMIYKKQGRNALVKVQQSKLQDDVLTYDVLFPNGTVESTTREFLHRPEQPEIANIPVTTENYREAASTLSDEQLDKLAHPQNLSPQEQEFLDAHHRLFHLPYAVMFRLAKLGVLPKHFVRLINRPPPCASCMFGQAHRKPWRSKTTKDGKKSILRSPAITKPGQCVAVDQIVSAQPGLVPQDKGQLTRARIWGCTVFVDYATSLVNVVLMRDLTAESTLEAKREFEDKCTTKGVMIKHYHADNGRFAEPAWKEECKAMGQNLTFCGVGAHHQNAIVERKIKDLTLTGRTLLLHAMRYWPEYISQILWPFAIKCAEERINNLHVDIDGKTPEMRFADSPTAKVDLKNFHTFGCPCYILDSRVQSNPKGLPKWEPRARLGIYLGHSPAHAGSVALVMNPKTGLVSPQFHVVFDDTFSTVPHIRAGTIPPNWEQLIRNSSELSTDEDYDLTRTWFESSEDPADDSSPIQSTSNNRTFEPALDAAPVPANDSRAPEPALDAAAAPAYEAQSRSSSSEGATEASTSNEGGPVSNPNSTPVSEGDDELKMPEMVNLQESGLRRSPRLAAKKAFVTILTALFCSGPVIRASFHSSIEYASSGIASINRAANLVESNFDGSLNYLAYHVFAAGKENNETYTFREMLKQDDRDDFIEAMQVEVDAHQTREHWKIIPRSQMPKEMKTIMAIWSFKRKRHPDGLLNKHKARLCAHGGMQQWGVNYWETYAPVVNWISVRFLLILAELLGLETKALDFVLAFPQADLDVPIYMEIPIGVSVDGIHQNKAYVLRLLKSLYGLKQASSNWYSCLKQGLEDRGFKESQSDPCVFIRKDMIILVYVDDCVLVSPSSDVIKVFIDSLTNGPEQFAFTDEGSMEKYLGVDIQKLGNGEFVLRQPFLIQRILEALGIEPSMTNKRSVPVIGPLLSKDPDGPVRKGSWSYRSVIGMLGYLQGSTRPDISMAVHQCARFNASPMLCHEKAVKRIARYLLSSSDKGIHYKPDPTKGLEVYVDADFAGGWTSGDVHNPECVLSRTGYVIMYAGCPITWSSKLQTEIALSTTEAEYIALSQSMRETIPFLNLMAEIGNVLDVFSPKPKVHCKVFEDNMSCIKVAESPKFTPRTKHIAIKYHHFRKHVADGTVTIHHVDTKQQIADIFTKPLDEGLFNSLRYMLMGW